jgi:hypothetical protein
MNPNISFLDRRNAYKCLLRKYHPDMISKENQNVYEKKEIFIFLNNMKHVFLSEVK